MTATRAAPTEATESRTGARCDAPPGWSYDPSSWRERIPIIILALVGFGIAVGPLGAVSITLVMIQPLLVHGWCTLCLTSALISVLMIGPAMDELLTSLQFLKRRRAGVAEE